MKYYISRSCINYYFRNHNNNRIGVGPWTAILADIRPSSLKVIRHYARIHKKQCEPGIKINLYEILV